MLGSRLLEFVLKESKPMKKPLPIYVVKPVFDAENEAAGAWEVQRWEEHPALVPFGLEVYTVSTAAGDMKLHLPYVFSRDPAQVGWAFRQVERLHPKPQDMERLESLSQVERVQLALDMTLEYIALAEDGRGHNDRSRYLARCIRQLKAAIEKEGNEAHVDAD